MIVIICAMSEERDAFLSIMSNIKVLKGKKLAYHGMPIDNIYYQGKIGNSDVAIVHSGTGKVYAAIVTSQAIFKFKPDLVINVGTAGSLNENVHVKDVIVADRVADWDVDVPGWERSITSDKLSFETDRKFLQISKHIRGVKIGDIVSADEFIYKKSQTNVIKKYFPSALCGEMEGSSIACTCYAYGIKCAVIRSISDETLIHGNYKNIPIHMDEVCLNAAKICVKIIEQYEKVV